MKLSLRCLILTTLLFTHHAAAFAITISNCNIGFDGDSLTYGVGSTAGHDYPTVAMTLGQFATGSNTKVVSAFPGRQISNASANYPSEMQPSSPVSSGKCGYLFLFIGINDVVNDVSAASIESQLSAFWGVIKADNWKLVAMTMTIAGQPPLSAPQEAVRLAVNAWIRTQTASYDYLYDTAQLFVDPSDLVYFQPDAVHFTDAGYARIAHFAYLAVDPGAPLGTSIRSGKTMATGKTRQ